VAKKRDKERAAKKAPKPKLRLAPVKLPRITGRLLDRAIRCLPGYDPYTDPGACEFKHKLARNAVKFFHERLKHVKGRWARQPLILEEWEIGIVANLFGWVRPDGLRRFQKAFIFVPRKNAKTTLSAGIVNLLLFKDGEPGAEIYGMASEHRQACMVFEHAMGMVLQDEDLESRCKIFNGQAKAIELNEDRSIYRVLSHGHDAKKKHGYHVHAAIVDEVHALPDGELLEALETGTGARTQPLIIEITTSDYDREDSVCNDEYDYAVAVRDGTIEDRSFLPVIYEAPKDADWTDPKVWAIANPNLDVSVSTEFIEKQCKKAQARPSFENTFKRLHLNMRTAQDTLWIPKPAWDACAGDVDPEALRGCSCFAGVDLASKYDLTTCVLMFPEGNTYKLLPFFWVPSEIGKVREHRNRKLYERWMRAGVVRVTDGNMTDYNVVERDIIELGEMYGIREIAIDRAFQGDQMATNLSNAGFEVVIIGQGFLSMYAPSLEFETLVMSRRLIHGNHPIMNWMAGNVSVEWNTAGNCFKPIKTKDRMKIDGVIGAVEALARAMVYRDKKSVYSKRGVRTF
jgi:phage terminase large subunit-like protein